LWVTIKGEPSGEYGFVLNINILKQLILDNIISKIDHKNINLEVEFMKDRIATTENLAIAIWNELYPYIKETGASLHCVKIEETENNSIEYYG
jgi:6-pyruvoyltetrahydropterin/6-carboxytetrahydropterin synthase